MMKDHRARDSLMVTAALMSPNRAPVSHQTPLTDRTVSLTQCALNALLTLNNAKLRWRQFYNFVLDDSRMMGASLFKTTL